MEILLVKWVFGLSHPKIDFWYMKHGREFNLVSPVHNIIIFVVNDIAHLYFNTQTRKTLKIWEDLSRPTMDHFRLIALNVAMTLFQWPNAGIWCSVSLPKHKTQLVGHHNIASITDNTKKIMILAKQRAVQGCVRHFKPGISIFAIEKYKVAVICHDLLFYALYILWLQIHDAFCKIQYVGTPTPESRIWWFQWLYKQKETRKQYLISPLSRWGTWLNQPITKYQRKNFS